MLRQMTKSHGIMWLFKSSWIITMSIAHLSTSSITKRHQESPTGSVEDIQTLPPNHTPPPICDDGKTGIEIDLHGESDWKCMETRKWNISDILEIAPAKQCLPPLGTFHQCINNEIDQLYTDGVIPNSGPHRTVWAAYGEYLYVPPGRYVHNLEHGGVVFMYHPCAPSVLVEQLKQLAISCTWKYLLTAYPHLTKEYPFAVITYGCVYKMSSKIDENKIRAWIRKNLNKSPEVSVYGQGHYNHSLLKISERPREGQSQFCPDIEKASTTKTTVPITTLATPVDATAATTVRTTTTVAGNSVLKTVAAEEQSNNNPKAADVSSGSESSPDMSKHLTSTNLPKAHERPTATPRTNEVFWAVGSLAFLFTVLSAAVCYTKLWRKPKSESAKLWHDGEAHGTTSVKVLVRKFPNLFKGKLSENSPNVKGNHYTLIEDEDASDDEI